METQPRKNEGKRKKGLATEQRILDVAAERFARAGYDGVSVREIAALAGIRESSVYNHFENKEAILLTLYDEFVRLVPGTRPSEEELDRMLTFLTPEEIFKAILFHVGKSVSGTLANTAQIISYEKFKNPRAAEMYYRYVVGEPAAYYERLIRKMIHLGMVQPVDARFFAEQYNYVSIALTKEYIMSQYGLADGREVVGYMVRTLNFYCELMKRETVQSHDEAQKAGIPER
jgi:AcrR family transcriptional regulator